MKNFEKQQSNENFNHQENVINTFKELGYTNIKVQTSLTNGISHYVRFEVAVLNANKLFMDMDVLGDFTDIEVRVSDHYSNLYKFGSSKNKMTMASLMQLRKTGAIAMNN